jgi:hypothetical protein
MTQAKKRLPAKTSSSRATASVTGHLSIPVELHHAAGFMLLSAVSSEAAENSAFSKE